MKSFDSVTIDSDLESISTERIRQHLQSTVKTRTAQETQSGAHGRRLKYTQLSENQILSSDDEGIVGEENGKYVKRYRHPRAPSSVQRRERKDQSRRKSSTTSTFSTTSNEEQNGTIRKEFSVMEVSLAGLKKQKAAVLNVVEKLRGDLEEAEREHQTLQLSVTQTRTHTQLLCNELHKLKNQRDSCVKEVRALQEGQAAVQAHKCTCNYNPSPHRHINSSCVSLLEREEMDRLLDNTKLELFSEQRRFRKKMDSMQERLEEVTQELELREEESRSLREKCAELEEKLNAAVKRREELQECMQRQRVEQEGKLRALEKIIAQKELLLLGMQDEKNSIQAELIKVREEHRAKLQAVLEQSQKEKEEEVELMKTKLTQAHEHELQRVHSQEQEVKTAALREQALVHKRNTESLHSSIQLKEQEVKRLQKSVKQQQEVLRRREEELRAESFEQVKKAVEQEQIKFEEHRAKSLKEQKRTLEEQIQVVEKRGREEVEKEKRNALALQNKIVQMQTRINELENEVSVQTAKTGAINKEHHAETQRLCRQLKQEADSESSRLKKCVKQSEKQLQDLKFKLAECERVHQEAAERQEQQNTVWAQDIGTECACLQELLTHNGLTVDTKHLSHSGTVSESVLVLKSLRKPVQHLINSLQNRISSLTNTTQQISTEKDLELRLQREQLTIEKERALNSLKEKLIQEHIEELSSMSKMRLCEDDDGVVASLRRQLQAKDEELRKVQRNMAQWKEKTTKRLARKFEEELNTELERWKVDWLRKRKVSKARSEPQWRLEMLEGEMRHLTQNYREHIDAQLTPASSTNVPGLANTPSSHDLASYKLLLHLQGRIRQLQADKQTHTPSPACLNRAGDLAGSYLETIAPLQTRCVPERSSMRTAPS
ncbi:golgin subfamily A member 6-like protein 6 isoform X2 [Hoplias malabaricus]|uniref:golgin subfamily A member 6-like protein 6 isoform X2 n=1 Tax=Hoplias malabaricus TaxID=27720 RepID=UPI003462197B